jgi:hypothetical protein
MRSIRKKTGSNAIASDFTPIYLYCPIAAKRIKQLTPNARLIIMLRNPVDRAYSEYRMFKSANVDPRSFEQAIEDGFNNVSLSNYVLDTYVSRGIYEPYVKMYYDLFNKEQIMIIKSEDFFSKPEKVLKDILAFLDLPQDSFNINDDLVDKNQGDYDATIKEETRRLLQNYYQPHNHSLYNLLGVDMEWDART